MRSKWSMDYMFVTLPKNHLRLTEHSRLIFVSVELEPFHLVGLSSRVPVRFILYEIWVVNVKYSIRPTLTIFLHSFEILCHPCVVDIDPAGKLGAQFYRKIVVVIQISPFPLISVLHIPWYQRWYY